MIMPRGSASMRRRSFRLKFFRDEHLVTSPAQIDGILSCILAAMAARNFSASDGLAVQLIVRKSLQQLLPEAAPGSPQISVRVTVDGNAVVVDLDAKPDPHLLLKPLPIALSADSLSLLSTYATQLHIDEQGRRIRLLRVRGKSASISGPPTGYDFQI